MNHQPLRLHAIVRRVETDDDRTYLDATLRIEPGWGEDAMRLAAQLGDRVLVLMLPQGQPEPAVEVEPEPQRL